MFLVARRIFRSPALGLVAAFALAISPAHFLCSRKAGDEFVSRNRVENDQAIEAMKKRGLVVHDASAEVQAKWRAFVEPVYPRLRGTEVPAELYDEVVKLLQEFRAQAPK